MTKRFRNWKKASEDEKARQTDELLKALRLKVELYRALSS
jgi:hypothetical protein